MSSIQEQLAARIAGAQETTTQHPFLPPGKHVCVVRNARMIVGGNKGDSAIADLFVEKSTNPEVRGTYSVVNAISKAGVAGKMAMASVKNMTHALVRSMLSAQQDSVTEPL